MNAKIVLISTVTGTVSSRKDTAILELELAKQMDVECSHGAKSHRFFRFKSGVVSARSLAHTKNKLLQPFPN